MKRFLLRRIGVADDRTGPRPTLHDCIEVVLSQAPALMGDVLDGLTEMVAAAKGKASLRSQVPLSRRTVERLQLRSVAIKNTFLDHLRQDFYGGAPIAELGERSVLRFDDLQLFDSAEIDASIEFALAQQEIVRCVEDVIPSLHALVSSLLGWVSVQPHLNPLRPEVFVRALQACLREYAPTQTERSALNGPSAGLLGISLRQLYSELCDWLRSQGIEPALSLGTAPQAAAIRGSQGSVARTLITLDKLRKLLSGELTIASGGGDFLHTVPASFEALEELKMVEPMLKRLADRARSPESEARSESPDTLPSLPGSGSALGRQLGAEVVRMMLENLDHDERIPGKVRVLLRSMEPLLIRLGQNDPRFFSERQHPARALLDRITHRSLAYATDDDEAGYTHFLDAVSNGLHMLGEEADAARFAHVLQALEQDWEREDALLRQRHEEAARALVRAEQRNLLAQRLAQDFEQRLAGKDIPDLVDGFLRGPWAQVVAQSQLDQGDAGADSLGYLGLVDDLLWSVQYRLARRNRVRLVQLVPSLLIRIRQGLQSIGYEQERILQFFDALITVHEKAFEGPRQQGATLDAEAAVATTAPTAESVDADSGVGAMVNADFWGADEEIIATEYLTEGVAPVPASEIRPLTEHELRAGAWVDLIVDGQWLRAQLTWVSPHRTLFMFVSSGGLAHSMSRRVLERLHLHGRVRFVSDGHLVDRALDAVARIALENDLSKVQDAPAPPPPV